MGAFFIQNLLASVIIGFGYFYVKSNPFLKSGWIQRQLVVTSLTMFASISLSVWDDMI